MALDPYQLCPCGSGKKVRFCCSKDILPDLEKVIRAVQGDQRLYALNSINKLIEDKGPRLALLALKADVELAAGQFEHADETIDTFLRAAPDNPVALALSSIYACHQEDLETAIEDLQQALERVDETVPASVYSAIGYVGQILLKSGDVLAARGHFLMQANMAGTRDSQALQTLVQINMLREVPLLLKADHQYAERPEGVTWAERFDEAMQLARRGAWIAACEVLDDLEEDVPGQPAIVRNIAILSGWVGQRDEAALAWRKYSQLAGVSLDDAIEAEALAQLLDPTAERDELDAVTLTYTVTNTERLMELLLSSKLAANLPFDPAEFAEENEPPPKALFVLLDKPVPESAEGLSLDSLPSSLGELLLYGKQTDRDARLEFSLLRDEQFESKKRALTDLAGELLAPNPTEIVEGQVSRVSAALTWNRRFPDDAKPETRAAWMAEARREATLKRWPDLSLKVLGGRTPREAAQDPALRIPLLAAILLLELSYQAQIPEADLNELRRELHLPTRDPLDPAQADLQQLSIVQLPLVEVHKLADEELISHYRRAVLKMAVSAIIASGEELLRRESVRDKVKADDVYQMLIRASGDSGAALKYVARARQASIDRGESPATWLLAELPIRLSRLELAETQQLIRALQSRHINEPGIAQGLYEVLVSFGIITPDGTPAIPAGMPARQPAAEPAMAAAGSGSKLWTPESSGAAPAGEPKSKLWVPGME